MSSTRFLIFIGTLIVLLLTGLVIDRYRDCQEKGGDHCRVGNLGMVLSIGVR